MSGFGERFRRQGYTIPKPLIEIDGLPIIGHVINLFPGETEFTFICNETHLASRDYDMRGILLDLCPTGRIIGIPPHKLGPIFAVRQINDLLDPNRPIIINYCDFSCYWDWSQFKSFVLETACDGAIPAYKGFHPHSLGSTNYAYLKEKGDGVGGLALIGGNPLVADIQEKKPFTDNRIEEFASSGTYYFANAKIMADSFKQVMDQDLNVGGEFYVSMAYKALLAEGKKVAIYPLEYFMQWGTPEDVDEYCFWSSTFKRLASPVINKDYGGSLIIPMAGMGSRFAKDGYTLPKPLIPISGKPMALQAIYSLPKSKYQSFILRSDMQGLTQIESSLSQQFPNSIITEVPKLTKGQACSALIGLEALEKADFTDSAPITFGACDNGILFDQATFVELIKNPKIDVIVWGARGHTNAIRNPEMFGWIDANEDGTINNISVKTPLASSKTDPIVIGTFTFKSIADAKKVINALIERNGQINGEFYLDSCINDAISAGMNCHLFEVEKFISWGTPNDLKTFEYWQSCFHKWAYHPYRLENDPWVNENSSVG